MPLTIIALGSRGDVQPYIALGRGLSDAGHRVRIATYESFRATVAGQGLDFHPIPGDARQILQAASQSRLMGTRNPFRMMRAIMRSYGAVAADYVEAFSAEALRDSTAVLNQLPAGLFGRDLAEAIGVPHLALSVIPLTPTRAFPSPLLAARSYGGPFNAATYHFSAQLVWSFFFPHIRAFRRGLGLSDPPRRFRWPEDPVINGFSPRVVPRPPDWPSHVHVTGYWTLNEAGWQPPEPLRRFLEAGPPPVFIGFGSMIAPDPAALARTLLKAVALSGQRAVIGQGWAGLPGAVLPQQVFMVEYTPYEWLFPRMAGVVHHGGSGTTGFALRSGVPSMVVPFGADQPYWGERTRLLGCGPGPLPFKTLTAERLASALQRLTADSAMQARAREFGEQLSAEDGIGAALERIERSLARG